MQLGARWPAGATPHSSVPEALWAQIRQHEARIPDADSWTINWLEGKPYCTLDDRVRVTLDGSFDLEASDTGLALAPCADGDLDDDSDDWLNEEE